MSHNSYSGNTNAITVYESRISLKKATPAASKFTEGTGACFTVKFGKFRGLHSEKTMGSVFGLHKEDGWQYVDDNSELIETFMGHLKTGTFSSQKAIANKMKITESKASRLRKEIVTSSIYKMTNDDINNWLSTDSLE